MHSIGAEGERGSAAPLGQARASIPISPYQRSNPPTPARQSCVWPKSTTSASEARKSRLSWHVPWSPDSRSPNLGSGIAESLRPFPEKLPFSRDYWRRRVRSRLPPDFGTQLRPNLPVWAVQNWEPFALTVARGSRGADGYRKYGKKDRYER
jgi:hypothetical protein